MSFLNHVRLSVTVSLGRIPSVFISGSIPGKTFCCPIVEINEVIWGNHTFPVGDFMFILPAIDILFHMSVIV